MCKNVKAFVECKQKNKWRRGYEMCNVAHFIRSCEARNRRCERSEQAIGNKTSINACFIGFREAEIADVNRRRR